MHRTWENTRNIGKTVQSKLNGPEMLDLYLSVSYKLCLTLHCDKAGLDPVHRSLRRVTAGVTKHGDHSTNCSTFRNTGCPLRPCASRFSFGSRHGVQSQRICPCGSEGGTELEQLLNRFGGVKPEPSPSELFLDETVSAQEPQKAAEQVTLGSDTKAATAVRKVLG